MNQITVSPPLPPPTALQPTQPAPVPSQPVPAIPTITPYQRAMPVQPTPFGIPMAQPGQTGSLRQPRGRTRRAANQEATAPRNRRLVLKVMMVLFPRDVSRIILSSRSNPLIKFLSLMVQIKMLMGSQTLAASNLGNNST